MYTITLIPLPKPILGVDVSSCGCSSKMTAFETVNRIRYFRILYPFKSCIHPLRESPVPPFNHRWRHMWREGGRDGPSSTFYEISLGPRRDFDNKFVLRVISSLDTGARAVSSSAISPASSSKSLKSSVSFASISYSKSSLSSIFDLLNTSLSESRRSSDCGSRSFNKISRAFTFGGGSSASNAVDDFLFGESDEVAKRRDSSLSVEVDVFLFEAAAEAAAKGFNTTCWLASQNGIDFLASIKSLWCFLLCASR